MIENMLVAAVGGFLFNAVPLFTLGTKPKEERPDFKDLLYWLPYLGWPIIGAFLVYVYESPDFHLTKLLSFHIGLASASIVNQMFNALPIKPSNINLTDLNQ